MNKTETLKYRFKLDFEEKYGKRGFHHIFLNWLYRCWKVEFGDTIPLTVSKDAKRKFCSDRAGDAFARFLGRYMEVHTESTESQDKRKKEKRGPRVLIVPVSERNNNNTKVPDAKNDADGLENECYSKSVDSIELGLSIIFQCQSVPHTCGSWFIAKPITINACCRKARARTGEEKKKANRRTKGNNESRRKREEFKFKTDEEWERAKRRKEQERRELVRLVTEYVAKDTFVCWKEVNGDIGSTTPVVYNPPKKTYVESRYYGD